VFSAGLPASGGIEYNAIGRMTSCLRAHLPAAPRPAGGGDTRQEAAGVPIYAE